MEKLIKLTSVLYKLTKVFPEKEPLRIALREKALRILSNYLLLFSDNSVILYKEQKTALLENTLKDIKIIITFLELAQEQNWAEPENLNVLGRVYQKIGLKIALGMKEKAVFSSKKEKGNKSEVLEKSSLEKAGFSLARLNGRQKKIIQVMQKQNIVQIKDLEKYFPQTSKRTLRRDMNYLLNFNFVLRKGDKNNTVYQLKKQIDRTEN